MPHIVSDLFEVRQKTIPVPSRVGSTELFPGIVLLLGASEEDLAIHTRATAHRAANTDGELTVVELRRGLGRDVEHAAGVHAGLGVYKE